MTEKTTLKAFVLFLFVFSVMALSQAAFAALSLTPTVPGYTGGTFSSPAGGFTDGATLAWGVVAAMALAWAVVFLKRAL